MPSEDLTDVTLESEDHESLDDHNDSDDPVYHDDHDDCDEDEDGVQSHKSWRGDDLWRFACGDVYFQAQVQMVLFCSSFCNQLMRSWGR